MKKVVSEPRTTGELPAAMSQFYAAVASGRGALFFAVCRGKVPPTPPAAPLLAES